MNPRTLLLTLALLAPAVVLTVAPASPAAAQEKDREKKGGNGKGGNGKNDGKGDGKSTGDTKEAEKDPKDTPEWAALSRIGAEFASKDAAGLTARVPAKGRLRIALGGDSDGDYSADQAKGVLETWFREKGEITCTLKKLSGRVGIFDMTVKAGNGTNAWALHAEIQKLEGGGFALVRLEKLRV